MDTELAGLIGRQRTGSPAAWRSSGPGPRLPAQRRRPRAEPPERPGAVPAPAGEKPSGCYQDRLLRLAQLVALASLLAAAAAVVAGAGAGGARGVHLAALALFGLLAAGAGLLLAATARIRAAGRRRLAGSAALLVHLALLSLAVGSASGLRAPFWVLFLPVVLVTGAGTTAPVALGVGALAAAGVYAAAAMSGGLGQASGYLLLALPLFPAAGWAASAYSAEARRATRQAADRRLLIERDVAALSAALARLAEADLRHPPALGPGAAAETTRVAVAFADTLVALRRCVRSLAGVGGNLGAQAELILGTANQQTAAAAEQQLALRATTATAGELAGTARGIAETAREVTGSARETMVEVLAGEAAARVAAEAMTGLARRVAGITDRARELDGLLGRIGEILAGIDELAVRTERLALAAAIESAWAGELGAGFSVVAERIRELSQRSRDAGGQARALLGALAGEVSEIVGLGLAGGREAELGEAHYGAVVNGLQLVVSEASGTVAAAGEIAAATARQELAADAAASATISLVRTAQAFTDGSQRYLLAAGGLRELAAELAGCLGRFRLG